MRPLPSLGGYFALALVNLALWGAIGLAVWVML